MGLLDCDYCSFKTRREIALTQHVLSKHTGDLTPEKKTKKATPARDLTPKKKAKKATPVEGLNPEKKAKKATAKDKERPKDAESPPGATQSRSKAGKTVAKAKKSLKAVAKAKVVMRAKTPKAKPRTSLVKKKLATKSKPVRKKKPDVNTKSEPKKKPDSSAKPDSKAKTETKNDVKKIVRSTRSKPQNEKALDSKSPEKIKKSKTTRAKNTKQSKQDKLETHQKPSTPVKSKVTSQAGNNDSTDSEKTPEVHKKDEGRKRYICDQCDYKCMRKNQLHMHKVQSHENPVQCSKCDFVTRDPLVMASHEANAHFVNKVRCPDCKSLKVDVVGMVPNGPKLLQCYFCSKCFRETPQGSDPTIQKIDQYQPVADSPEFPKDHVETKHNLALHCDQEKELASKSKDPLPIATHAPVVTIPSSRPMNLHCQECKLTFESQPQLFIHLKRKHYKTGCIFCDVEVSGQEMLHYHVMTVHGVIRRRNCQQCISTTFREIYVEGDELRQLIQCTDCPYGEENMFESGLQFRGIEFPCSLCPSAFVSHLALRTHAVKAHGIKKAFYMCQVCEFGASKLEDVVGHMGEIHGMKELEETLKIQKEKSAKKEEKLKKESEKENANIKEEVKVKVAKKRKNEEPVKNTKPKKVRKTFKKKNQEIKSEKNVTEEEEESKDMPWNLMSMEVVEESGEDIMSDEPNVTMEDEDDKDDPNNQVQPWRRSVNDEWCRSLLSDREITRQYVRSNFKSNVELNALELNKEFDQALFPNSNFVEANPGSESSLSPAVRVAKTNAERMNEEFAKALFSGMTDAQVERRLKTEMSKSKTVEKKSPVPASTPDKPVKSSEFPLPLPKVPLPPTSKVVIPPMPQAPIPNIPKISLPPLPSQLFPVQPPSQIPLSLTQMKLPTVPAPVQFLQNPLPQPPLPEPPVSNIQISSPSNDLQSLLAYFKSFNNESDANLYLEPYICTLCPWRMSTRDGLLDHIRRFHGREPGYDDAIRSLMEAPVALGHWKLNRPDAKANLAKLLKFVKKIDDATVGHLNHLKTHHSSKKSLEETAKFVCEECDEAFDHLASSNIQVKEDKFERKSSKATKVAKKVDEEDICLEKDLEDIVMAFAVAEEEEESPKKHKESSLKKATHKAKVSTKSKKDKKEEPPCQGYED